MSLDLDLLADAILAAVEDPDYQPPALPAVTLDLVRLAGRVDATLEETVAVIERDAWVAARLRAEASEEAKATGIKIGSMRQVCLYFGLLRVRDVVIEAALADCVFRSDVHRETMARLFRHARATAHLGRAVAESTEMAGECAYVAGLLHDVGFAGALHVLTERDEDFGPLLPLPAIWPALERIHGRVGAAMARHWGFPPEVVDAIEAHHDLPIGREASPMAAAIAIASELAHHEGFGLTHPVSSEPLALSSSIHEADADLEGLDALEALELKQDGDPADRLPAHVLDRQLALLGLDRSKLHLIAHRAKSALAGIDGDSRMDEPV
ncbi:MAG: HDOD domain-containing protein [Myxococcota bacterium]